MLYCCHEIAIWEGDVTTTVDINPDMLIWAREAARLTQEEAAKLLGLGNSKRSSAAAKLDAFEAGRQQPTEDQLVKMAKLYRWPEIVFSLESPPLLPDVPDFRHKRSGSVSDREEGWLDSLISDYSARQSMVRSVLEDDEDYEPLQFIDSASIDTDTVETVARSVRSALGIDQRLTSRDNVATAAELFQHLRSRVEELGVFVVLVGNLGNYHSKLRVELFRGFALADDCAPFIVINSNDAITARSFTLLHELAHLFLGITGISSRPTAATAETPNWRVEKFCNDVASEVLLPGEYLDARLPVNHLTEDGATSVVEEICSDRCVGRLLVSYRLWQAGCIDGSVYDRLEQSSRTDYERRKGDGRETPNGFGGPNWYVVRRSYLGTSLIRLVRRALGERELTYTKAATILGVGAHQVRRLVNSTAG